MGPFPLTRLLDRSATVFLGLLAAFAIAIPVLNLLMPAGSPLHVSTYLVALILFIQRRPRGLFPQTGRAAEGV